VTLEGHQNILDIHSVRKVPNTQSFECWCLSKRPCQYVYSPLSPLSIEIVGNRSQILSMFRGCFVRSDENVSWFLNQEDRLYRVYLTIAMLSPDACPVVPHTNPTDNLPKISWVGGLLGWGFVGVGASLGWGMGLTSIPFASS